MALQITARDRRWLLGGAVVVAVALLFRFAILPAQTRLARLQELIPQAEKTEREVRARCDALAAAQQRLAEFRQRLANQPRNFAMLGFLEQTLKANGLGDRVSYLRPTTTDLTGGYQRVEVDLRMERLTLDQIVAFLRRLEKAETPMTISSFQISHSAKDAGILELTMRLATVQPAP